MATYIYPTNAELREIEQEKIPLLTATDPIFGFMPVDELDASLLMWEQRDNYVGLQQARGLNGQPANVKHTGGKRYQAQPGVYGEFIPVDELELTERRMIGTYNQPISLDRMVMDRQDQLLGRRFDRIRQILWTLVTTGTFSVAAPNGAVVVTDTYTTQTYAASVAWATVATATPLANFRAVKLLARGKSVSFGRQATAYMNQITANRMLANTNSADIYGRRTTGLGTANSLVDMNTIYLGEDLPQVVVHDDGYLNDSGTFVPFIPDGKVVVVGARANNAPVGAYLYTRNANNPNMEPGAYMKVFDNGDEAVPRQIEVHDGHNGGPVLYYPSAIVVMSV